MWGFFCVRVYFCDQTGRKRQKLVVVLIGRLQSQKYLWNVVAAEQKLSLEAVKEK